MLIDDVYIQVKAGDGGDGVVHFFSDRWRPKGGPDGGDGGKGGDVYFEAVSDITVLGNYRQSKKYQASNGGVGGSNNKHGANAPDLILKVPVGTVVNYDNGTSFELTVLGQKELAARGGSGGRGNTGFASASNTTPLESTKGFKPEYKKLHLQLKLIADIGLIGLPNAGKSSLLNELTKAKAKVANYPFTTLEPNLGVLPNGKVIADIPGLIEGASDGRGLGAKFLRHVERTQILIHCVAADNPDMLVAYKSIRKELEAYSETLATKKEIVVMTKSDLLLSKPNFNYDLEVSVLDDNLIKELLKLL